MDGLCGQLRDNVGDEDADALADCADATCAETALCPEVACGDGLDNDEDGLADCADDDCWGNGCSVGTANVASGTSAQRNTFSSSYVNSCSGTPVVVSSAQALRVEFDSAYGTVQYISASGAQTTCEWSDAGAFATRRSRGDELSYGGA